MAFYFKWSVEFIKNELPLQQISVTVTYHFSMFPMTPIF